MFDDNVRVAIVRARRVLRVLSLWCLLVVGTGCTNPRIECEKGSCGDSGQRERPDANADAIDGTDSGADAGHLDSKMDARTPGAEGGHEEMDASGHFDASGDEPDASIDGVIVAEGDVGPAGGSLTGAGYKVVVPEGALSKTVRMRLVRTEQPVPAGYAGYSAVYSLEPRSMLLAKPVTVTLPFSGDATRAAMFWSDTEPTQYSRLGGRITGATIEDQTLRVGTAFVADGVSFSPAPRRACAVTKLIGGNTLPRPLCDRNAASWNGIGCSVEGGSVVSGAPLPHGPVSSAVAVAFVAEDCNGQPVSGLTANEVVLEETSGGVTVPIGVSEGGLTLTARAEPEMFVTLLLDVGNTTVASMSAIRAGARAFVELIEAQGMPIHLSLSTFSENLVRVTQPRLDSKLLLDAIDATEAHSEAISTSLHGSVVDAIEDLAADMTAFNQRNGKGAFASGYIVVFTDGVDVTARKTKEQVIAAREAANIQLLGIGLETPGYAESALSAIATAPVLTAEAQDLLPRDFAATAQRLVGLAGSTYLLSYCSPKRSGMPTAVVRLVDSTADQAALFPFDAEGMDSSCLSDWQASACSNKECGGLGCGACDDRTEHCVLSDGKCDTQCMLADVCDGEEVQNARGYAQTCAAEATNTSCAAPLTVNGEGDVTPDHLACLDTTRDIDNCGGCGQMCPYACRDGKCATSSKFGALAGTFHFPDETKALTVHLRLVNPSGGSGGPAYAEQLFEVERPQDGFSYMINEVPVIWSAGLEVDLYEGGSRWKHIDAECFETVTVAAGQTTLKDFVHNSSDCI